MLQSSQDSQTLPSDGHIHSFVESVRISNSDLMHRHHLRARVEAIISEYWSDSTVSMYGSCVLGIATHLSDVDLCILSPHVIGQRNSTNVSGLLKFGTPMLSIEKKLAAVKQSISKMLEDIKYSGEGKIDLDYFCNDPEPGVMVEKLAVILHINGFKDIACFSMAPVPFVRCRDQLGVECDISWNKPGVLHVDTAIAQLFQLDERCEKLALIIKMWSKVKQIAGGATCQMPNSFFYLNLLIFFLQSQNPPILPCINPENITPLLTKNTSPLSDLLVQFFHFYAFEFESEKYYISIRTGKSQEKASKQWDTYSDSFNHHVFSVEHPQEPGQDLGRPCDQRSIQKIKAEMGKAHSLIAAGKPLSELLEDSKSAEIVPSATSQ